MTSPTITHPYSPQQLKEQCERIWKELPLAYPCNLTAWLTNEERQQLNLGYYVGAKGLVSLKGKRMTLKGLRKHKTTYLCRNYGLFSRVQRGS